MKKITQKKSISKNTGGDKLIPSGLSVENLKRVKSLCADLADLGFPDKSGIEMEMAVFRKETDGMVLQGDLKISC